MKRKVFEMNKKISFSTRARIATALFLPSVALLFAACTRAPGPTFKIGAVFPLSGDAAQYGEWGRKGAELAKEEINRAGGINGKPIELVYEDSQAEPQQAIAAATDRKSVV